MHALLNENFDLRASLYNVGEGNTDMIQTARACGVSAKFAGSGGAIVGFLNDPDSLPALQTAFKSKSIRLLQPTLI